MRRYKCLLCFDYDLCGPCFDFNRESNNHHSDHPMQCLLTKYDYGTFYAGEVNFSSQIIHLKNVQVQTDLAFSYTCPICGRLGHTVLSLKDHLNQEHNNSNLEVICPICASLSDGNANQQTKNLAYHLSTKHNSLISGENQGLISIGPCEYLRVWQWNFWIFVSPYHLWLIVDWRERLYNDYMTAIWARCSIGSILLGINYNVSYLIGIRYMRCGDLHIRASMDSLVVI